MSMKSTLKVGSTIMLLLTGAGCVGGARIIQSGNNEVELLRGAHHNLGVTDVTFNSDGLVRSAQVKIRNLEFSNLVVAYYFIWFDQWGEQVGVVDRINKTLTIPGEGMQIIRHNAPYPSCTSFKLFIELQ